MLGWAVFQKFITGGFGMVIIWDGRLANGPRAMAHRQHIKKVYLGKVTNFFTRVSAVELKIETGDLKTGDEYVIMGSHNRRLRRRCRRNSHGLESGGIGAKRSGLLHDSSCSREKKR